MFLILLRFSHNKSKAGELMQGHKEWIERGFAEGVFLFVGSLKAGLGGAILAHDTMLTDLRGRLAEDPFVAESVVSAEITEIVPSRADERLAFLLP